MAKPHGHWQTIPQQTRVIWRPVDYKGSGAKTRSAAPGPEKKKNRGPGALAMEKYVGASALFQTNVHRSPPSDKTEIPKLENKRRKRRYAKKVLLVGRKLVITQRCAISRAKERSDGDDAPMPTMPLHSGFPGYPRCRKRNLKPGAAGRPEFAPGPDGARAQAFAGRAAVACDGGRCWLHSRTAGLAAGVCTARTNSSGVSGRPSCERPATLQGRRSSL